MWHEKIFYGKCYLAVVWHKLVKVIKLSKKIASKDSGIIFMIIIIYFYNYDDDDDDDDDDDYDDVTD